MKTYWGSGGIAPRFPDLGTRRRWVVSFTIRPLYSRGKSRRYALDRRLGGSQSQSGRGEEEKNSQPPPGIEPPNPYRPARSQSLNEMSLTRGPHREQERFAVCTVIRSWVQFICSTTCSHEVLFNVQLSDWNVIYRTWDWGKLERWTVNTQFIYLMDSRNYEVPVA
jgi:hypothetical protein